MNKRSKKLELSRENVRSLTSVQLTTAAGGGVTQWVLQCGAGPSQEACSITCPPSGGIKCY
ncbi:MAG: hypothetical protein K8W52_32045 [Deltaproteobacteria bacterium]|nr:hypothetical protein [Deltaproteobacteria bacterium]